MPLTIYNGSYTQYIGSLQMFAVPFANIPASYNLVTSGAVLYLDAGAGASYPGSGTNWFSLTGSVTGSLINGPTYTLAGASSSINFDGTNDFMYFNPSSSLTGLSALSVNMWLKFPANEQCTIWYKSDNNSSRGWFIEYGDNINGTGQNGFGFSAVSNGSNLRYFINKNDIPTGSWTNLVVTYTGTYPNSGNDVKIYVDGIQNTNTVVNVVGTGTHGLDTTADPITFALFGTTGTTGTDYMSGSAGVLMIYNREITSAEVTQNYNALLPKYTGVVTTTLTHLFDAGSSTSYSGTGATWTNLAGSNNLTLVNTPTYVSRGAASYFLFNGVDEWVSGSGYAGNAAERRNFTLNFILNFGPLSSLFGNQKWLADNSGNPTTLAIGSDTSVNEVTYMRFSQGATNFFAYILPGNAGEYTFNTGTNYMMTLVSDATKVDFYMNGSYITSSTEPFTATGTMSTPARILKFGIDDTETSFASMSISHIMFYSSSLSSADVSQNYNVLKTRYGLP
jgi:hypothetical protein